MGFIAVKMKKKWVYTEGSFFKIMQAQNKGFIFNCEVLMGNNLINFIST
jgi:hypothetical protein